MDVFLTLVFISWIRRRLYPLNPVQTNSYAPVMGSGAILPGKCMQPAESIYSVAPEDARMGASENHVATGENQARHAMAA
jgi:hypothetical protein